MEMEKSRKKRVIGGGEVEEDRRERLKKLKGEEGAGRSEAEVVPSEEEVEEFFAILRRMKVAVKYFDERGRGGKEWREALEQPEVTVDDAENVDDVGDGELGLPMNKKDDSEVIINDALDLNALAPEAAESGGV